MSIAYYCIKYYKQKKWDRPYSGKFSRGSNFHGCMGGGSMGGQKYVIEIIAKYVIEIINVKILAS